MTDATPPPESGPESRSRQATRPPVEIVTVPAWGPYALAIHGDYLYAALDNRGSLRSGRVVRVAR